MCAIFQGKETTDCRCQMVTGKIAWEIMKSDSSVINFKKKSRIYISIYPISISIAMSVHTWYTYTHIYINTCIYVYIHAHMDIHRYTHKYTGYNLLTYLNKIIYSFKSENIDFYISIFTIFLLCNYIYKKGNIIVEFILRSKWSVALFQCIWDRQ